MLAFALSTHGIDDAIFRVADALEVPVLVLALLALAVVIFELGTFIVEVHSRRGRGVDLEGAASGARKALLAGDIGGASKPRPWPQRADGASALADHRARAASGGRSPAEQGLADFDFDAQRRLARTRLLVERDRRSA